MLLAATVTMWVRSYRRWDALPRRVAATTSVSALQVQSMRGRAILLRFRIVATGRSGYGDFSSRSVAMYSMYGEGLLNPPGIANGLGFGRGGTHGAVTDSDEILDGYWIDAVAVPYWFLTLLTAIPSVP